ncbi:MAG: PASTA domain-containing protein [Firmicutes bacterium]|nr:PASTA domain-containing protein [Bacillota bacterium]
MIDRVLGNRYKVLQELGEGGMAVVYKGHDLLLNRFVTIKILRDEYTRDEDFVRRFRQEARSVASLSHPGIVSVFDVGCENGVNYLVMEYVEGQNLKSLIQKGQVSLSLTLLIAKDVCEALEHAHNRGIVHRDVKPHNILVTESGRAKLTDFGIARTVGGTTLAATRAFLGSVQYISPEQARGEPADARSDIYSLGAVLYEMLTGRPPFTGENPVAVAIKHIQENPPPITKLNPEVPAPLAAVVEKAMAKNPGLRYQSAGNMAADVGRLLEDLPGVEKLSDTIKRGRRRLKPAAYLLLGLVFVLFIIGTWWGIKWYVYVPEVVVPDVQGLYVSSAQQVLTEHGLRSQVQEVNSTEVEKGKVLKQDIEPGNKVKRGRLVTLLVSLGPQMGTVPDVRERLLQDAEMILANEGFRVGERKEVYSDKISSGLVADQDPVPGVMRPKDSPVTLYVSKGPAPVIKRVPELVGLTLDAARQKLNEAGFTLEESIKQAPSTEYLPGYVLAQNPAAGTNLEAGKPVRLTVSEGPGPAPKEASVYLQIPDDGREHVVRITVNDARGLTEAYNANRSAGERVVETITYYGPATISVYLDGQLVREQSLS